MKLFELFHDQSKNTERLLLQKTISVAALPLRAEYKWYERFSRTLLTTPPHLTNDLSDALLERHSMRKFASEIDESRLSSLLYFSCGTKPKEDGGVEDSRMYPSAGRLYPIEIYVVVFSTVGGIAPGVYHYFSPDHALYCIKRVSFTEVALKQLTLYDFSRNAKFAIMLTSRFNRIIQKYGERGYRFSLLEAGGIAQNISLVATALGIASVQMGGTLDVAVEELLGVDGTSESLVHSIFLG